MRANMRETTLAVFALALLASPAWAGYCGVARYNGVVPCSHQQDCHTVYKTVRCKVYEQKEITCTRTVYDRVCEDKVINVTRMVPETCQKEVCYTVCKPVYETKTQRHLLHRLQAGLRNQDRRSATRSASRSTKRKTKDICYTVCKPVYETKTKDICYTVCKPVYETKTRNICYTVCKPVYETKTKNICYTVCKPVYETKTKTICYTVCKPVYETKTKDICYTVCKPVYETEDPLLHGLQAGLGNQDQDICYTVCKPVYETKTRDSLLHGLQAGVTTRRRSKSAAATGKPRRTEVPGPVMHEVRPRAGLLGVGSLLLPLRLQARPCKTSDVPMPAGQVLQEGLGSGLHREDDQLRARRSAKPHPQECYTVCKMVPETKTCTYTVCHMVPEQRVKTCTYTVCKMVPEQRVEDLLLHGLQDGARERTRPAPTRSARWCRNNA